MNKEIEIILSHPDYHPLAAALASAYYQSVSGKGHERHNAQGLPFVDQPILRIARSVGCGFPLGQAIKKTEEAATMLGREQEEAAIHELKGAIVYLAAAIIRIEEGGR